LHRAGSLPELIAVTIVGKWISSGSRSSFSPLRKSYSSAIGLTGRRTQTGFALGHEASPSVAMNHPARRLLFHFFAHPVFRRVLLAAFLIANASSIRAQLTWDFTGGTGTPSSVPANISGGTLTAVNLAGGSLLFDNTSPSSGYTGAGGGNNASVRTVTSATLNTSTSTYFAFTVTPGEGYQIQATSLTLGSRSTATGPTSVSLFSSIDSFTTPLASFSVAANSTWTSVTLSSSVLGATDSAVTFRLYGAPSSTSASANWRVDDMSLNVSAISAIPEPSTYAAIVGSVMLGAAAWKRRQRNSKSA
jgi:hypothetical protein